VFACFFWIGRATDAGSAARAGPTSRLAVTSVRAAMPFSLNNAPPIEIPLALRAHSARRVTRPIFARTVHVPSQTTTVEAPHAPLRSSPPAPSISSRPA